MDIETIDNTVADIGNKLLSGALSPDTRNRFYNLVNLDLLKLKAGLPEDYQAGQPISKQGHQITFKISDDIAFLMKFEDINRGSNNFFARPSDYAAFDYLQFAYITNDCGKTNLAWKSIEAVTGAERAIRTDSHLIPPTMKQPIVWWNHLGFGVDPETVQQIRLYYLRLPNTPFRNYVMNSDQDVFDRNGGPTSAFPGRPSVDAEWPETMFGDFVIRVCRYAGINLREDELVQFSSVRQLSGQ